MKDKDKLKEEKETKEKVVSKKTKTVKKVTKPEDKKIIETKKEDKTPKKKKLNEEFKTVNFNLLEVIVIILITGITVCIASGLIVYNNYDKLALPNKVESPSDELNEFVENYNNIVNNYVEEVDKQKLLDSAIKGMYDFLGDEYSVYVDKEETDTLEERLLGEYTGIGIEITTYYLEDDSTQTVITRVFSDTPAMKAGLKEGDILTHIDGVEVTDSSAISETIKNGSKDSYEITYIRDNQENKTTIKREHVIIDSITSDVYDNVGYIKIETFSLTTKDQILKQLDKFDENVKSLIIDVRDNTGGYLNSAYEISDLFIEKGKVIYQLRDRENKITKYKALSSIHRKFDKITVIINENSASASEVLALALKESANAKLVGVKSFGKGTVQEKDVLSSGAMVKYTSSYWLSPNGNSINKEGITPDIEETDVEKQLQKAIEVSK